MTSGLMQHVPDSAPERDSSPTRIVTPSSSRERELEKEISKPKHSFTDNKSLKAPLEAVWKDPEGDEEEVMKSNGKSTKPTVTKRKESPKKLMLIRTTTRVRKTMSQLVEADGDGRNEDIFHVGFHVFVFVHLIERERETKKTLFFSQQAEKKKNYILSGW
jgi:hypothetical protein